MSVLTVPAPSAWRPSGDDLLARWPSVRPFLAVGSALVIAGGLVAALTRPTSFAAGPWVAAYLVLVGGVAQVALGGCQAWLTEQPPERGWVRAEVAAWNLGVAATVVGTLVAAPIITTCGGIATMIALVLFLLGLRTATPAASWAVVVSRALIGVVLVSIPVGLALAWSRHG